MSLQTPPRLTDPTETGTLGVCQLKRIWASYRAAAQQNLVSRLDEAALDHVVFCGLNLALEETIQYLSGATPSFAAFEEWVLVRNNGALDPRQIARINAAVLGERPTPLAPSDVAGERDRVLSAADHAHFAEHGYVVVRGAVPREQAQAAAEALWQHRRMDPDNPETWYVRFTHGIMVQLFHHPALAANRESVRVRRAFEEIWGTDDLWMTVDRLSFNPPEREGWRFPGPRLHWDADLTIRPLPFATQGLIYLTDTAANQGAFACVCGFHHRIEAWLAARPPGSHPQAEELGPVEPTPIAAEAGDLVIWHHALPHGATPNTGTRPRIVQYVNALPTPARRPSRYA